MQHGSKQSGARATGLLSGPFHTARLRLTAVYILILAIILCISSGILYSSFANKLAMRFRGVPPQPGMMQPEGFIPPRQQDVLDDLVDALLIVNGILLVGAGALSYVLAGLTLEPIQASYERQRRFLGDASHELRTPLAILRLDLENEAQTAANDSSAQVRLASHLEEVDRMTHIVQSLLTISRLDEGQMQALETTAVDLLPATESAIERFKPLAKKYGVNLEIQQGDDVKAKANLPLLDQVLGNVIKNAIIYNKPGGSVKVRVARKDGAASVSIEDTGIGMGQDDQAKVFDRFYRIDKSRSRQTGGSGLGLSIVQSAMASMDGEISLQSTLDQGTTVTLTLPSA
jgi:signal transduction histidine kinase